MFDKINTGGVMAEQRLNVDSLVAALNSERQAQGLSWRKLANEAGVSPSTLTRMQQGKLPDVNTFNALTSWLGTPAERFIDDETGNKAEQNPLAVVSTLLRGKKELSPKAMSALDELVRAAVKLGKELK